MLYKGGGNANSQATRKSAYVPIKTRNAKERRFAVLDTLKMCKRRLRMWLDDQDSVMALNVKIVAKHLIKHLIKGRYEELISRKILFFSEWLSYFEWLQYFLMRPLWTNIRRIFPSQPPSVQRCFIFCIALSSYHGPEAG